MTPKERERAIERFWANAYMEVKKERYEALAGDERIPAIAIQGRRYSPHEGSYGETLYLGRIRVEDLWTDEHGDEWANIQGGNVLLLNGTAEKVRELSVP